MADDEWEEVTPPPREYVRQRGREWPCQLCQRKTEGGANIVCSQCKADFQELCRVQREVIAKYPALKTATRAELIARMWTKLRQQTEG